MGYSGNLIQWLLITIDIGLQPVVDTRAGGGGGGGQGGGK